VKQGHDATRLLVYLNRVRANVYSIYSQNSSIYSQNKHTVEQTSVTYQGMYQGDGIRVTSAPFTCLVNLLR